MSKRKSESTRESQHKRLRSSQPDEDDEEEEFALTLTSQPEADPLPSVCVSL